MVDTRWQPLAEDAPRDCTIELHASTAEPLAIAMGMAIPVRDLTPLVKNARQSDSDLNVTLTWHDELLGPDMPTVGQWLLARLNGRMLCLMMIDSISDYRLRSGERSMTLVARERSAFSAWRDDPITLEVYPQGTPLSDIANDIARRLGLQGDELLLPRDAGYAVTPQRAYQASNITAWELVTQLLQACGYQPFIDTLGRLCAYPRNIMRPTDIEVPSSRVVGFIGSRGAAPIDQLTLKWRAPIPQKVLQENAVLATTSVTAGFFKKSVIRELYWSDDRTQQADLDPILLSGDTKNSALFVKNDINNGLVPVADQFFDPIYAKLPGGGRGGCIGCVIRVMMTHQRDDILTGLLIAKGIMAATPDGVLSFWGGVTLPIGRVLEAAFPDAAILAMLCKMGTGVYEVRGQTYDLVNPDNETVAYDPTKTATHAETIETDLVADEPMAQQMVTREFIFRARASNSFSLTLIDDPRVEVGDIVGLEDGTRILVTSVTRDLTSGSANLMELVGFPA